MVFTSRESRSILLTPSHGLVLTIYTKLTLSRDVYERFHANFRLFSRNFPFTLLSCTKGSFSSHLAKLEGSLLVLPLFIPSQLAEMFFVVDDRSSFSCRIVLPGKLRLQRRRHFRLRSKESLQRNGMSGLVQETQ